LLLQLYKSRQRRQQPVEDAIGHRRVWELLRPLALRLNVFFIFFLVFNLFGRPNEMAGPICAFALVQ
jgi:hypothetical protein